MDQLIVKRWMLWLILYMVAATSFVSVAIGFQMMTIRAQNRRSIEDRAQLHQQNIRSIQDRDYLHKELQETRGELKQLKSAQEEQGDILRRADAVIRAEEERQQRRRREEQQKAQPRPQSMQDMPPQTTTLTVTKAIADELAKRPDFVSMQPTYGPEDLWIVVLRGNPDLTARREK